MVGIMRQFHSLNTSFKDSLAHSCTVNIICIMLHIASHNESSIHFNVSDCHISSHIYIHNHLPSHIYIYHHTSSQIITHHHTSSHIITSISYTLEMQMLCPMKLQNTSLHDGGEPLESVFCLRSTWFPPRLRHAHTHTYKLV